MHDEPRAIVNNNPEALEPDATKYITPLRVELIERYGDNALNKLFPPFCKPLEDVLERKHLHLDQISGPLLQLLQKNKRVKNISEKTRIQIAKHMRVVHLFIEESNVKTFRTAWSGWEAFNDQCCEYTEDKKILCHPTIHKHNLSHGETLGEDFMDIDEIQQFINEQIIPFVEEQNEIAKEKKRQAKEKEELEKWLKKHREQEALKKKHGFQNSEEETSEPERSNGLQDDIHTRGIKSKELKPKTILQLLAILHGPTNAEEKLENKETKEVEKHIAKWMEIKDFEDNLLELINKDLIEEEIRKTLKDVALMTDEEIVETNPKKAIKALTAKDWGDETKNKSLHLYYPNRLRILIELKSRY